MLLCFFYIKKKHLRFLAHQSKFHIPLLSADELNGRTNSGSAVGYAQESILSSHRGQSSAPLELPQQQRNAGCRKPTEPDSLPTSSRGASQPEPLRTFWHLLWGLVPSWQQPGSARPPGAAAPRGPPPRCGPARGAIAPPALQPGQRAPAGRESVTGAFQSQQLKT